jgi:hypothetical protein
MTTSSLPSTQISCLPQRTYPEGHTHLNVLHLLLQLHQLHLYQVCQVTPCGLQPAVCSRQFRSTCTRSKESTSRQSTVPATDGTDRFDRKDLQQLVCNSSGVRANMVFDTRLLSAVGGHPSTEDRTMRQQQNMGSVQPLCHDMFINTHLHPLEPAWPPAPQVPLTCPPLLLTAAPAGGSPGHAQ